MRRNVVTLCVEIDELEEGRYRGRMSPNTIVGDPAGDVYTAAISCLDAKRANEQEDLAADERAADDEIERSANITPALPPRPLPACTKGKEHEWARADDANVQCRLCGVVHSIS